MQALKKSDNLSTFVLEKLADIPSVRHVKIKKEDNPFDSVWNEYFEVRRKKCLRNKQQYTQYTKFRFIKNEKTI